MSDDRDREEDPIADFWITNWEQQCIQDLESENDFEGQIQSERDLANQKLWYLFQNSATSVAQLYKDRHQGVSLWVPFQTAASTITSLYKESCEHVKKFTELGYQHGYQRRTRDLLNWARKRRRHIRREDLIAYLAGKNPPPRPPTSRSHQRGSPRPRLALDRSPMCHSGADHGHVHRYHAHASPDHVHHSLQHAGSSTLETDLNTFREALAVQSLNGAMSNISVGLRSSSPGSPVQPSRRRSPHHVTDLSSFISNEFARHCAKRPSASSPPHDVTMDSPTHKRSRLM